MKHSLQLRLSQHLTLTPQLQLSIRLLQLSTQELDQEIEGYLRDNPLLERDEAMSDMSENVPQLSLPPGAALEQERAAAGPADDGTSTATDNDPSESEMLSALPEMSYGSGRDDDGDDNDYPQVASDAPTLREHLLGQLALLNLSDRDRTLVSLLIDTLNDDGYITQSLEDVQQMLPVELCVEDEELTIALQHLQHLEPVGVGARSLAECLVLQLNALPAATPYCDRAVEVVTHHLDALASRDYVKLRRALRCDEDVLRAVQKLIVSLNPKPGRDFAGDEVRYVIPDVNVIKSKGLWVASLNRDAMPKLRVNRMYANILGRNRGSAQQLSGQLQEAKWLIKNVQQRFDTILRVSQAIVDRQRNFLEHGAVAMRPLVLREIAETLELHESTVSRVTTNKYMRTPRGIFELKFFFGSHVGTDAGGAASSTAIRALIKQLVSAENSRKPLSDSQISSILGQQGMVVARRTVAKYRESLQILPGNLRKTL
ncbi:MAG: RNA polymerase factor sigma-54 [Burkholderiales bacterium]